jgi:dynactin complex subunit
MTTRRSSSRLSLANKDPTIDVGDVVLLLSSSSEGIVRFSGPTEFAGGHWIGIELKEPIGKNDGSVQDVRYFECAENHGIFVRAAQVRLVCVTNVER